MTETILLIDDRADQLDPLVAELRQRLAGNDVVVIPWIPGNGQDPKVAFDDLLKTHDIRLVVTDYDLTTSGNLGLFGATIVDWCQLNTVPVGDFSRGHATSLASEPNLFELRVPVENSTVAGEYIAHVYKGFSEIRRALETNPHLLEQRSPSVALAHLLDVKHLISEFSQYGIKFGSANSNLVDRIIRTASREVEPDREERVKVLCYIMGHLLKNSILRFAGPLMDRKALAAYIAVDVAELNDLEALLAGARYTGPFADVEPYYWTEKVDSILLRVEEQLPKNREFESPGQQNRALAGLHLGRVLRVHNTCQTRCQGEQGGFLCPYTKYTVCQRSDCSVASSAWIPAGARLSRFERDFYDEWAPILGM